MGVFFCRKIVRSNKVCSFSEQYKTDQRRFVRNGILIYKIDTNSVFVLFGSFRERCMV